MAADAVGPDPKSLWQDQAPEADPMSLAQIHALVRQYDAKDRRRIAVLALCMGGVGAVGVLSWIRLRDPVMTVLFVGGELATIALAYRLCFPVRDPAEPAGEYLRRRLRLRLQYLKGRWIAAVGPLLPVILWMGWIMVQRTQLPLGRRLAPFIVLVVAMAWVVIRTRHRARKVQADLDELEGLMNR